MKVMLLILTCSIVFACADMPMVSHFCLNEPLSRMAESFSRSREYYKTPTPSNRYTPTKIKAEEAT